MEKPNFILRDGYIAKGITVSLKLARDEAITLSKTSRHKSRGSHKVDKNVSSR